MKWEYRTVTFELTGWLIADLDGQAFNDRLNKIGEEGWELVSVMDINAAHGATRSVVAVFKRPLI